MIKAGDYDSDYVYAWDDAGYPMRDYPRFRTEDFDQSDINDLKHIAELLKENPDSNLRTFFRVESRSGDGRGTWWTPDIMEATENYFAGSSRSQANIWILSVEELTKHISDQKLHFKGGQFLGYYTTYEDYPEEINDNTMPYYIVHDPNIIKRTRVSSAFMNYIYENARFVVRRQSFSSIDKFRFSQMQYGERMARWILRRNLGI